MSSDWPEVRVEEIAAGDSNALSTGPFGSAIGSRFFASSGVPVIRGSNLSADVGVKLIDENLVFVSFDKAKEFRRSIAKRGDLVFTCWGTINQVGLIHDRSKYLEYVVSNKQMKLTVDPKKVDSKFLYYVFSSPEKQHEILSNGIGAAVPGFNLGQLKRHAFRLPPLDVQEGVVKVLDSLDAKIDLNRRINQTLEAMAQAIFKSWFVDFDPVKAKIAATAEGRNPLRAAMTAISGKSDTELDALPTEHYEMLVSTAALFPDGFEGSAVGQIPKGWSAEPIGNLVDCVGGATPDTKNAEFWEPGEHAWTTPKDLSGNCSPVLLSTERKISSRGVEKISSGLLPKGTLLMSSRAPIGYLAIAQLPVAINQGYIAMPSGGKLPPLYLYFWCAENMDVIKSNANGSTFLEISKKAFRPILALRPSATVLSEFVKRIEPFIFRITIGEKESVDLASLRDTLLPKLLSGELSVAEAVAETGA